MKASQKRLVVKSLIEGLRRNGDRIFAISQETSRGFVAVDRGILRQSGYTRKLRNGIELGYKAPYSCIYLDSIDKNRGCVLLASGCKRSLIHLKPGDIVDNGFGEARTVIAVKKRSVEKPRLFIIETESGKRMILTDNHQLPTPKGLLEVKDLKVGDSVWVKEATKHSDSWCKGLTKETDSRLMSASLKLKGRPLSESTCAKMKQNHWSTYREHSFNWRGGKWGVCCECGAIMYAEVRNPNIFCDTECENQWRIRRYSGRGNPMFGKQRQFHYKHSNSGFREDLGHYVRSSWEANIARLLLYFGITYFYEPERFDLNDVTYCPDFYLPTLDTYLEVKGYPDRNIDSVAKFAVQYPDKKIALIMGESYLELEERYGECVKGWEWKRLKKSRA